MALTPTEESQTRALIAQNAALLSLASNEAAIISELGAGDVTLADLPAAASIAGSDLLLVRQGTTERSALASQLAAPAATETASGIVELATVAEAKAGTDTTRAVTAAGLQAAKISQGLPVGITAAATTDIGAANSVAVEITGGSAITSFGTNYNGPRFIRFLTFGTLTHSAILSLPGNANISRNVGDTCIAYPNSAGTGWNVCHYQRGDSLINRAAASGANSDITSLNSIASINGGQLAGLRNAIINGNFSLKQRAVTGTVVLAAGVYGHDRWKAGAGGCTYTFSTSLNVTTITISSGTLQQVIEGVNLQTGSYRLSFVGTAAARIDAGPYGSSGAARDGTAVAGTNQTVEFGTGTVSRVQYEFGLISTAFEQRPIGLELLLCQRYYEIGQAQFNGYTTTGINFSAIASFKATKRVNPTVTATNFNATSVSSTPNVFQIAPDSAFIFHVGTATGGGAFLDTWTASAEI